MNEKLNEKLKEINLELENFDKDKKIINNTILKVAKWCNKTIKQIKNELELRMEQQDSLEGVRFFFEFINIKEKFILELQIEVRKSIIIECNNETASVRKVSFYTSVNAYEYCEILRGKKMGIKLSYTDLTKEKLNLLKKINKSNFKELSFYKSNYLIYRVSKKTELGRKDIYLESILDTNKNGFNYISIDEFEMLLKQESSLAGKRHLLLKKTINFEKLLENRNCLAKGCISEAAQPMEECCVKSGG